MIRSGDVLPVTSRKDLMDSSRGNAIMLRQFSHRDTARLPLSNGFRIGCAQQCHAVKCSALCCLSAFSPSILLVVGCRSQKEMIGANAWAVVAMMANLETFRNHAEMDEPRGAMSLPAFSIVASDAPVTIPSVICPNPKPAAISFVDV